MKLTFFMVVGLIVNTLFAVLYPAQIFGEEPLGLSGEIDADLGDYLQENSSDIWRYNSVTGELERADGLYGSLKSGVQTTDGDSGILSSGGFSFVDWVKEGWANIKTAAMFIVGFIVLLWNLVYPLNFLVGIPFSILYLYSIIAFILGRA